MCETRLRRCFPNGTIEGGSMARFLSLALLASLALVCLGQLEAVAAGCVDAMGDDGPSIGNFRGKGRELSQCVREYRQRYGRDFECGMGLRGKTCVQIKDHFQSFVDDLSLCLAGPTTAAPTTTPLPNPKDCKDLFDRGETGDRVATIFPDGETAVSVRCIDDATVILNRDAFTAGFNQNYSQYAAGFGPASGDYYIGNDVLRTLTSSQNYKLRVDIVRPNGTALYAEYTTFQVGPADDRYNLTVGGYSGNAGDAMVNSNGEPFTTLDNLPNEFYAPSVIFFGGGWWYPPNQALSYASVTADPINELSQLTWGDEGFVVISKARLSLERM